MFGAAVLARLYFVKRDSAEGVTTVVFSTTRSPGSSHDAPALDR
jgi:hypothetical protein